MSVFQVTEDKELCSLKTKACNGNILKVLSEIPVQSDIGFCH
jgi:hypothetical protein